MGRSLLSVEELPGSYGLPFIGEAPEMFGHHQLFYWKRFGLYGGGHFKTQIMGMKTVCLIGPDANQFVLKDGADNFSSGMGWSLLKPLLGEGIVLQDEPEHRRVRKLMYPAFHHQAVAGYFNIIENTVEEFLRDWSGRSPINLYQELRKFTLFTSCRLLMGVEAPSEIEKLVLYYSQIADGIKTVIRSDIPATKFGRAMRARRHLEAFLQNIIQKRRQQGGSDSVKDVLGLLLTSTDEEGNRLADSETITQSLHLLFGGHETTAKLLSWVLFELSSHPDWLDKLKEEQKQVLGGEPPSYHGIKNSPSMNYVIKEIERLYPPIYTIPRGVVRDFEYAGYLIPKGWYVVLSPLLSHRLTELYLDPHEFQPERFAPGREEDKKHPFALIGFGGGAHRCLGYELAQMQVKIFLSTLLNFYGWKIVADVDSVPEFPQTSKVERTMRFWCERLHPVASTI
ncbi:MAG: putative cytochrome P450 120 [Chroococcopsis gigantea SAG 12.99]|jgi:cytochrome P450|nr:cytochrome P450 [Chlorogloea purpurea SAG 13.99]MDV3001075.1 putative cytochrome P450 120 [Chroococcopsis gigantea SAG 12.99]